MNILERIITKRKIKKLVDILKSEGKLNNEEEIAVMRVASLYSMGARTEEKFIEGMSILHELLYTFPNSEREELKKYRRATTQFLRNVKFRERILNLYSELIPLSKTIGYWKLSKLHREYKI